MSYGLVYIRECQEHFSPFAGGASLVRDIQPPLTQYRQTRLPDGLPVVDYFRIARENEAALRRTLSRARRKRHRRFETRSLAEWSVSRYDEAIVRLSFFG